MTNYAIYQDYVQDALGNIQVGATIEVRRESDNALVTIYSTRTGTPKTNPTTTDSNGYFFFYVAGGAYKLTITVGATVQVYRHVAIGTAAEGDIDYSAFGTAGRLLRWDGTGIVTTTGAFEDAGGIVYVTQVGSTSNYLAFQHDGTNSIVTSGVGSLLQNVPSSKSFIWNINSVESMRLDSSGKFGLNESAPQGKAHFVTAQGALPSNGNTDNALVLESSATAGVGVGPSLIFRGKTGNSTARYGFAGVQGVKASAAGSDYSGNLIFTLQGAGGGVAQNEAGRFAWGTNAPMLLVGATTPITATDLAEFDLSQNASTYLRLRNVNTGSSSRTGIALGNSIANQHALIFINGVNTSDYAGVGTMMMGTVSAYPVAVITGNSVRSEWDASGNFLHMPGGTVYNAQLIGPANTVTPAWQYHGTTQGQSLMELGRWSADASPPEIDFFKSRGAAVGTRGLVSINDNIGALVWRVDDGTNAPGVATIKVEMDAATAAGDLPTRMMFFVTPDATASQVEVLRVDNAGRLILGGGGAAVSTFSTGTNTPHHQHHGNTANTSAYGQARYTNDGGGANLFLAKSRSATLMTHTIVQLSDNFGVINFAGSDGTNFVTGAQIVGTCDATPGASNDMPACIKILTCADGTSSLIERMRIPNSGKTSFGSSGVAGDINGVGWIHTYVNNGTVSSGTVTPDPLLGNEQYYTNGGAHTLAPMSNGPSTVGMEITNNGSAGAITTSGFTKVVGDAFTTTNGHKFYCVLKKTQTYSLLSVTALQ